jgi:hypothetical protein
VQWDGTKWASVASQPASMSSALNNVGRNLLHNGMFNVQQRGVGPWTINGAYTADRWLMSFVGTGAALSVQIGVPSDIARSQIGDEQMYYVLDATFTGTSGVGDYNIITHCIENARRLAGKTVTVSMYAVAATSGLRLGINGYQSYGTGGTPTAAEHWAATGASWTLGTGWARYSVTFTVPTSSGKTFGTTAGTNMSALQIFLSSGATNNANAGNIGVQSGQIQLWGMQLEIGATATQLEKIDFQADMANCQRFFQSAISFWTAGYYNLAAQTVGLAVNLPTTMRVTPTMIMNGTDYSFNVGSITWYNNNYRLVLNTSNTAIGVYGINSSYDAIADL